MTEDIKLGSVVEGEVTNITNFGAFVKLENGEEGLIHISEIANEFVKDIASFITVGEKVKVKILKRNPKNNKLELSLKQTAEAPAETQTSSAPSAPVEAPDKSLFLRNKTKNSDFEDKMIGFLKKSDEKQIDIRRNLKNKQGISKKRR